MCPCAVRMWLVSLNLVTIFLYFAIPRAKQKLPCEVANPSMAHETEDKSTVTAAPKRNASAELEELRSLEARAKVMAAEALAAKAEAAKALSKAQAETAKAEAILAAPKPVIVNDVKRCSFVVDPCVVTSSSAQAFDNIYARNVWGSRSNELGTHTRSEAASGAT